MFAVCWRSLLATTCQYHTGQELNPLIQLSRYFSLFAIQICSVCTRFLYMKRDEDQQLNCKEFGFIPRSLELFEWRSALALQRRI